ncbi:phage tail tape measure protein [Enterococcus gilvus]|uniref:Phage tail tape measure protein, TP901 family, core region n=1 Tax=Enterococcus gilvus ATCC BAA-350 TaxID=1158614 RepID=R2VHW3_9ENTE|nr:phage tail tape measure protein [Enterococcus gilvus]EOI57425.1 phage tail tape measure protein, TP901 family, core region [Enterococcus gilvus ATCC BAA-350]EOW83001.1 phage tail tape measure protein, TP901 family, core region [Enterococcus gilvus ATCC BAA-350]OJG41040.1 phage tail tape measure protein, TP901 family, core region [Enterococcus gilvus]
MSKKESDVILNFETNGEVSYAKTVKEINKEMNLAATEYKNQVSAMDKDATQTEKLAAAKRKLEKQVQLASQRTEQLREAYQKSVDETGKYSAESEKLYKKLLESQTGENKLKDALDDTNEALKKQGDVSIDTANKLQKIEEAGDKIKGVGEKMTVGVTAPIVAAGAASLATFGEVDEALDTIITKTGATGKTADSLGESFKKVGANTHLPLQTVGEAIGEVNTQFGFMDKKLEDSTNYLLKYAEINDTDVSQSAVMARQAIEAYGLEYDDLNSVLDVTTRTSQNTGQSVDDLMQKAIDGAPQIKQLGLSFNEGVTLMGQFEQAGVDSGAALSSLSKATVAYAKDGKTLSQGMGELQDKIKNASSETDAINAASEVFGTKGGPRMADAIRRGTLNLEELAKTASESGGAVGDTYEATLDPIDKANMAMNNAKLAMADVGESIQIALLPFFEMAIDALQRFKSWFDSLDEGQKNMIITIALVAAAIGPFLVVLGTLMGSVTKVASGIRTLQSVFSAMRIAFATNPFLLVIAGIVLLIGGLILAYNKVKWFHDGVNAFFRGVRDVGVQALRFIGGYVGNVFGGIIANFNNFKNAGMRILNGIVDFITGVFTGNWSRAWQGVTNIFGGIFEGIAAMAKAPINAMIGLINGFLGGLNRIKIPKWVPKVGGRGFNISQIPYLAKGGHLINGQAVVGEAGPELMTVKNGKTTVTPLSDSEKKNTPSPREVRVEQHVHIDKVDANNPSELNRMNRKLEQASRQAIYDLGGVPG